MRVAVGRRFARLATVAVVRRPRLWPFFRPFVRRQFDGLAATWDRDRSGDAFAPLERALELLDVDVRRALDVGTGTGEVAVRVARRFPAADVLGVDLAPEMIEEARRKAPELRFEVADASRLPVDDASVDLVAAGNMIPFFDELGRVVAPGGYVVLSFSAGAETPIYVPPERLRAELGRRGFVAFEEVEAGRGTALVARKA